MKNSRQRRADRLMRFARWSYRLERLRVKKPNIYDFLQEIYAEGETIDGHEERCLKEEDRQVHLKRGDQWRARLFLWATHEQRPPIIGRWVFWILWLIMPTLRAWERGKWDGIQSVPFGDDRKAKKNTGDPHSAFWDSQTLLEVDDEQVPS